MAIFSLSRLSTVLLEPLFRALGGCSEPGEHEEVFQGSVPAKRTEVTHTDPKVVQDRRGDIEGKDSGAENNGPFALPE